MASLIRILNVISLTTCCVAILVSEGFAQSSSSERPDSGRPNIVLIVTDDQRPDTIRALGNEEIHTPTLDRLVQQGMVFHRAITAIPICVASRAELLTGRDGRQNGKQNNGYSPKAGVPHLASTLHRAGYETCYVGKWHTAGRPSTHGYETVEGLYSSGGGKFPLTVPQDWKGMDVTGYRGWVFQTDDRKIFQEQGIGLTTDISGKFSDAAASFLERRSKRPFFLHVNYTAPHDPLLLPEKREYHYDPDQISLPRNFRSEHPFDHGNAGGRDEVLFSFPRTPEQTRAGLAVYYSVIEQLDAAIGSLIDSLRDEGLDRNTLVIFTSDHGLAMGSHGLRGKQNMYDHSIGVPLIFVGPNIPTHAETFAQCYLRDLYPTICDYAEIEVPDSVQGKSLLPILQQREDSVYDDVYASFEDSQRMIRTNRWKYVRYPRVNEEQLFDLVSDPDEINNLAQNSDHQEVLKDLRKRLTAWSEERGL